MCKEFFDFLKEHNIEYREENGTIVVGGWLDLRPTKVETLPDNLVVGGWLDLSDTNIEKLPDNLVVGGWLDLSHTNIETLPDNLVVGYWLDLSCTNIKTLPDNLVVGGSLNLSHTNIETLPDNLVVGGSLCLRNTSIETLPDNLVVGDSLDLSRTNIKTLPDNLVVGGIYRNDFISEEEIGKKELQDKHLVEPKLSWRNGKYRVLDGIFCEVLEQRKNVFKVKIKNKVNYVVTDGINYSHGGTIKEAKKDLIYKLSNRDTSAYEGWTLDTKITKKEAIESYRVITGACEFGTKNFVESLEKTPRKITPAVVIKLTKGQYGHEKYKEFFMED